MPCSLIVGNWKMNGDPESVWEVAAIATAMENGLDAEIWLAPPFVLIDRARVAARSRPLIGAQDCHWEAHGAYTGDVSAAMLAELGALFVIVGHSERRSGHGETDAIVRAKAQAACDVGLRVIVCVGETEAQRDAGEAETAVAAQLAGSLPDMPHILTVAYEPVWAIGTGRTPTPANVTAMHALIRSRLVARFGDDGHLCRIIYGGSVKPDNAALLLSLPGVDGALVGGASLRAESLLAIARAMGD